MEYFNPKYEDYFSKINEREEYDYYDEVDIKEFNFDKLNNRFIYPCPCGDDFEIYLDDLINHEEVARCPSCSLIVKVIFDKDDLNDYL